MDRVDFHPFLETNQAHLEYAVIMALYQGRWVFVKHRERSTLEIPGGHREPGETLLQTARRELFEETGAQRFQLTPLHSYQVTSGNRQSWGLLAFAWIDELGPLPASEIDKVVLLDRCPSELTYPTIQPLLFEQARSRVALLEKIAPYSHVIFDWNGTLLDDTQICVDVISSLLEEHGLPRISLQKYREIFGFPVVDYYKKLGFDFEKHTFEEVGDRFIERYRNRIHEARLFEGVVPMIDILSQRGIHLSILSAASQPHLEEATRKHELHHFFDHVFGIDNHYASGKIDRGRELLREVSIPTSRTLLIGDTDHDLEVGKALGVDVLLVADGHQHYERLSRIHSNTLPSRFR